MVAVAQLVESRIVIPVVVGSSPISHPKTLETFGASLAARPDVDFAKPTQVAQQPPYATCPHWLM